MEMHHVEALDQEDYPEQMRSMAQQAQLVLLLHSMVQRAQPVKWDQPDRMDILAQPAKMGVLDRMV
jgi:hypothetical protein